MKRRDIAHARAGDKGRVINISVIAFDPRDYPRIARDVTATRVRDHLADLVDGEVVRYEMPNVHALNCVLRRPPGHEVSRSLALDAHGKSLSYALLTLEL